MFMYYLCVWHKATYLRRQETENRLPPVAYRHVALPPYKYRQKLIYRLPPKAYRHVALPP